MASMSINDRINHQNSHFKHFVVQTRTFQIRKSRNVDMYPRLKNYIKKQKEKRKQEMEMSEELKRAKREKELKHNQDKFTLGEIKDEISKHERRLTEFENDKHRLFAEFKKVLNEDDSRKNLQRQKEANAITNLTFGPPAPSIPSPLSTSPGSTTVVSQSLNQNNISSLKFAAPPPPPPPIPPPPTGPPINNPTVIPNSTMLSLQHPYFAHNGPPLPPPPSTLPMTSSGSSSSFVRSLNNGPSSTYKPPLNNQPSMYSKSHAITSPMLPINQSSSTNPMIAASVSMPFQTIPPPPATNERQRTLSSYKRQHEQANTVSSATLPPLNLASGHQAAHMPPFISGYKQPPLTGLHPGQHPVPPPPFGGLSIEHIQSMQNIQNIPFYQSLMMSNNPFINPNPNTK